MRILDAGCGSGAQCEWLLDEGADVLGIDPSPAMVEETRRRCADRGRFFVADLAAPLPIDAGSLDGITCSLALDYLEDWHVPLSSFANALHRTASLVLSLDHPFASLLPEQQGGYFDTELVGGTWQKGSVEVTQHFRRRPLSAVVDAFADAGFVNDRIIEPRPTPEALRRFPGELAQVDGVPWFIVYRLLRRPSIAMAPEASAEPIATS